MSWTFVRDNLYADFFPFLADDDGVIRGPAGDGRVSAVAQDDIAAALAAVLLDPAAHEGSTYTLTGPEALSLSEVADTMTRVLGRDYSYVEETLEEAYASRSSYGAPDWLVDAWVSHLHRHRVRRARAGHRRRGAGDRARADVAGASCSSS